MGDVERTVTVSFEGGKVKDGTSVAEYVEESYGSIILYPLYTLYTPLLPYMHLYTPYYTCI